jgi:epoxyqueuosine reductase
MHGEMKYMENYFDQRIDPSLLVPGAKSVVTLLLNYFPSEKQSEQSPKIAKYAWGKDYHEVIREKLNALLNQLKEEVGEINGRGFVDSAPVLERAWAVESGLGWIGKNGNLINKQQGSYFFIATLISDLELMPDASIVKDYCGSCTRCIDACPTDAILPDKVVDGSKCISYFTIELKELLIPENMKGRLRLQGPAKNLWIVTLERLYLSARSAGKVLRVARTIADLENSEKIEAFQDFIFNEPWSNFSGGYPTTQFIKIMVECILLVC